MVFSRRKGYKVGCQITSHISLRLKVGVRSQWGNGKLFLKMESKVQSYHLGKLYVEKTSVN